MRDGIKAIVLLSLVILMGWYLWTICEGPTRQDRTFRYHWQAPPQIIIKDKFSKRIGKQNYTIELAWVARTQDGKVYIERIR